MAVLGAAVLLRMRYNANIVVKWFAEHGINAIPEFRFDPPRRWRADFYIEPGILLEVEGGIWTGGRHTRGAGFKKDMEKYNRATVRGYRVLRTTPDELCMQETVDMIKAAQGI